MRANTRSKCSARCWRSPAVATHWEESPPTARQHEDDELQDKIVQAHAQSRQTYGAPRIVEELKEQGIKISKRRCACANTASGAGRNIGAGRVRQTAGTLIRQPRI